MGAGSCGNLLDPQGNHIWCGFWLYTSLPPWLWRKRHACPGENLQISLLMWFLQRKCNGLFFRIFFRDLSWTCRSRWGCSAVRPHWVSRSGPPVAPKIFFKSCSFQAILRESPYFEQILGSGPPPLGSKLHWAPLPKILDPRLWVLLSSSLSLSSSSWLSPPSHPPAGVVSSPMRGIVVSDRPGAGESTRRKQTHICCCYSKGNIFLNEEGSWWMSIFNPRSIPVVAEAKNQV